MGFKIKNSLTGEFEKLPILTLKGEKGETGGVEEYNKVDYMGNKYETLKQANDANVEYAVKTAIGEFNYLDYDGQHITATDTIEGRSKSAILKGNTLVNLMTQYKDETLVEYYYPVQNPDVANVSMLKPNTEYTLIFKAKYQQDGDVGSLVVQTTTDRNEDIAITGWNEFTTEYKTYIHKFTTPSNPKYFVLRSNSHYFYLKECVLLEGDYTNVNVPYFEGMQSVKMPVLTTTGKNLFDGTVVGNYYIGVSGGLVSISDCYATDYIEIESDTNYCINTPENESTGFYDKDKNFISSVKTKSFLSPSNAKFLRTTIKPLSLLDTFQLEEGTTTTPYEPYKSNILTVNEPIELRGIGDVQDELNVATDELTQNIGEIVFDGSESWNEYASQELTNTRLFFCGVPTNSNINASKYTIINNRFASLNPNAGGLWNTDVVGFGHGVVSNAFRLRVLKSTANTVNELKEYLKSNPIVVQYELAEKFVKTVDLSDNHVYSYKGTTYYDCSSAEGSLVPTLSVKVPTDVQATIAQQRETIQTLNSENERLNQIQEALKASMLDSQVQLMNLSWNTDFEVFTLRESIAPKDFLLDSRTGSNIDKFSQAKFIIENDCPDLEKLNSQIEYYFSKDVFSQEQFEELTDLISIVKGENGCEY